MLLISIVDPPLGKNKEGRRPDIIYYDSNGKLIYGQVGKIDAKGSPVPREIEEKNDLETKTQGDNIPDEVQFRAYNEKMDNGGSKGGGGH